MRGKIIPIFSGVLSLFESIFYIVQFCETANSFLIALSILFALFSICILVITVKKEFSGYIRVQNREKINKKIVDFIKTTGETIIFSRDLSWVNEDTLNKFKEKVQTSRDKLTIFMPTQTDISKKLEEFANVRYYGNVLGQSLDRLTSRYTIIHYGTDSVRMTYPQENVSWHINHEYSQGDPALTLAIDLAKVLDVITGEDNNNAGEAE